MQRFAVVKTKNIGCQIKDREVPIEFQHVLDEIPELKTAFKRLTPGRQRGCLLYFSSAKQPKTKETRIEKYIEQILKEKGLDTE